MEPFSSGLSLVLGRALMAWCEQTQPITLNRYLEIGGFQGLRRISEMALPDILAELRASGLRDHGFSTEPLYLSWQRFQQRNEPGELVVDATHYDDRSEAGSFLLSRNPFGLIEGLLIGAHTCGVEHCKLLLPARLRDFEANILNALETSLHYEISNGMPFNIELIRDSAPAIRTQGAEALNGNSTLIHHLETWYHLPLMLSLGANRYHALGLEGQSGTCLLTVGGTVGKPGLVEAPMGGNLWHALETLAGGVVPGKHPIALSFDNGMGGFLPPDQADIPFAPEELTAARVSPSPKTVWLIDQNTCIVDMTRRALYRYWLLSAEHDVGSRNLIARATRMVTEITVGKGLKSHISELEFLGQLMATRGLAAAWPLLSAISHYREQWTDHIDKSTCPSGRCIERKPAPCHMTCPANVDIPSFLAKVGHREYEQSSGIITQDNPLPYVCGLVCPAPCENACLRGEMDSPIHIRAMKAVSARHSLEAKGYPKPASDPPTGKNVAVVGAGPAGLTASYYLALKGHNVTIFEAQKAAGGMLRYGIPAYRLPYDVVDKEVEQIKKVGVKIETSHVIKNIVELRDLGFDAMFLGLGTQISRMIPIEGRDLPFVLGGLDFLKQIGNDEDPRVGPRVVVVGGGNVAIDVALSALRQGGRHVDMVCLEKRREMPAHESEIQTAVDEGVVIHNSWGPVSISSNHVFSAQRCTRVFDERGRFSPLFDPQTRMTLDADHLILAIGQATDLACVEVGSLVEVQGGLICVDETTMLTHEPGVFAGGDVAHGPRTVVEAIKAGKKAAASIHSYLTGDPFDESRLHAQRRDEVKPLPVSALDRTTLRKPEIPMRYVEDRKGNFHQIEMGLTDDMASVEANRCLRCDLCIGCGLCQLVCSELQVEALRLRETKADRLVFNDFTRPSTHCIGCGACSKACPTGAIKIKDHNGIRATVLTGSVVKEQKLLNCSVCGEPYASQAYIDHMKNRVGPDAVPHIDKLRCSACARTLRSIELAGFSSEAIRSLM